MSKKPTTPKESRNWYKDRYQRVLMERRFLMAITVLSLLVALGFAMANSRMAPLKSVEPFVIQVDSKSGITQTVDPLTIRDLSTNEAVNNYFVVQYIRARESYNATDIRRNYPIVRVMSENMKVYANFGREVNPNNPQSPAARLGSSGTRSVKFKSITYLKPMVAQARLLVEETAANGGMVQYHRIVTITFEYANLALTKEERYINPLGFRVTDYQMDEETLPR